MWRIIGVSAAAFSLGLAVAVVGAAEGANKAIEKQYSLAAKRLIAAALADDAGYEKLRYLTTRIGNRLSGSDTLNTALQWVAGEMRRDGFQNVTLQPVTVAHWVRGAERASVVAPVKRTLGILGLGGTIATPQGGIEAPVAVVHSFDELDKLGAGAAGRIVLLDQPWFAPDRHDERDRYGATSPYRSRGPSRAAKLGAKAVLVRSLTGRSLYTPHTGNMTYDAAAPQIPAAAITVEDAEWIDARVAAGDKIVVHLELEGHHREPDAASANVFGEIPGREHPEEIVVLGGHIDSWDVGQGAHDDGGGVVAAWQAVALIKQLGLQPRRTIRAAGWTNEENGARGAQAYRDALGAGVLKHVAAIEMDMGAEAPVGFDLALLPNGAGALKPDAPFFRRGLAALGAITGLLAPIGATQTAAFNGETDLGPLVNAGVPGLGLATVREHYFDWHHTNADTFDKINKQDLRKCIASLAVAAYVLADMPGRLGE